MRPLLFVLACCLFLSHASWSIEPDGAVEPATPAEIYGEGVRPTDWQSPADELAGFHLPPGFEVSLFASEPQIAKPLNMAFDAEGKLWLTQSVTYPYPAKDGEDAGDAVMLLVDTDDDGTADKITKFASGLNIPMGVLPYGDGCLCFSIPNLVYLRDTDGDGKCDQREIVLGPFDTTRDTHGMVNSLRDGGDGWIYACHGFNNQSRVAGKDGHLVSMDSGNTFRFRADGSRVEHFTRGQVNPFGMTTDDWGYLYSADCHSKPITQLIHGACYPSFGKPHDGLGFLPPMMDHLHGSTAICGLQFFSSTHPIAPLRNQMISGNVMTSRLNRNRVSYQGATATGEELADFMTSDDPWFRPVDIRMGLDGHIYVADFYNKIIGHYEVPLDHPGRDRTSGRIWQIRYRNPAPVEAAQNISWKDIKAVDLQSHFKGDPKSRTHALRMATERLEQSALETRTSFLASARRLLDDDNAHVSRAAAELLGRHGGSLDIAPLTGKLLVTEESDPVLRQSLRIAIRNRLQTLDADADIWSEAGSAELTSIMLGIERPAAARSILAYLAANPTANNRTDLAAHVAKHAGEESLASCIAVVRKIAGSDRTTELQFLQTLCDSQNAGPDRVAQPLREWAIDLIDRELEYVMEQQRLLWWDFNDNGSLHYEERKLLGGDEKWLLSTLGRGEKFTGSIDSDVFNAPDQIQFWLAGHSGPPKQPAHRKNIIRLIRVSDNKVLFEATPPRNDVAKAVTWDTSKLAGQPVRITCIDNDGGSAYAWLGFGEFSPGWIHDSVGIRSLSTGLSWIAKLGLQKRLPMLEAILNRKGFSPSARIQIAETVANLKGNRQAAIVLRSIQAARETSLIDAAINAIESGDEDRLMEVTQTLCKGLAANAQRAFVIDWVQQGANVQTLLDLVTKGWISPEALADPDVRQSILPRVSESQVARIETLTARVTVDVKRDQMVDALSESASRLKGDSISGQTLFKKHCAACHQLRGEGAIVGPQLDGAAARSKTRLMEDLLTPDRNIDQAFRTTSFLLDDGRVIVGLVTTETDQKITVVESNGKSKQLDAASIERRREAGRSLMPSNLVEVLSAQELCDLLQFITHGK
ncbi:MAG: PVC-type heme-binding CxxCH protein [Rubripirellula sp.]